MDDNLKRRYLNQIMRDDFKCFLQGAFNEMHANPMSWNWHHDIICDALFGIHQEEYQRLIINIPPRSLKSFICNIAWPAWLMGHNPRIKIISISYAQELAAKFSREQRQLMSSSFYQNLFLKTRLNPKKSGETEFETTKGGFRLATSTGGTLTGRGADVIIIDDPVKPQDAFSDTQRANCINWLNSTLMTRLDNKKHGAMVLVMQRLHEEDPTGHFLEKGGWKYISLASIAPEDESWETRNGKIYTRNKGEVLHPEYEPIEILDSLKRDMGNMNFSAQYQQQPMPTEGNIIKEEWFKYYTELPHMDNKRYVISIDSAMKDGDNNDYSVCTAWLQCAKNYYLVDVIRKKMNFPELHDCVAELAIRYRPIKILVEDASSGTVLIQQLKQKNIHCTPRKPIGDKTQRLASSSLAFEQGRVLFPASRPHWLEELIRELLSFPCCKHDDQVDSVSQFLNYELTKVTNSASIVKLKGV